MGHTISYKTIDRGLLETIGPTGVSNSVIYVVRALSTLQSGLIKQYAFIIFSGATIFMATFVGGHEIFFLLNL